MHLSLVPLPLESAPEDTVRLMGEVAPSSLSTSIGLLPGRTTTTPDAAAAGCAAWAPLSSSSSSESSPSQDMGRSRSSVSPQVTPGWLAPFTRCFLGRRCTASPSPVTCMTSGSSPSSWGAAPRGGGGATGHTRTSSMPHCTTMKALAFPGPQLAVAHGLGPCLHCCLSPFSITIRVRRLPRRSSNSLLLSVCIAAN